jgi:hypothetical protein
MTTHKGRPSDDVSSAPESGTVRDNTSANQPVKPQERGAPKSERGPDRDSNKEKDAPHHAGEERG